MVRVYLNKLIEILDKFNISHHNYVFVRKHVCWQAYELMSDFCSGTNVDFFNQLLFEKMRFMKTFFLFFIKNNSPDYIDLTI